MTVVGAAKRVRVYIGEGDQHAGRPLYAVILELLHHEGCSGATVLRGIAGFGARGEIHTAAVLRLAEDLPIVIEWIDSAERAARVLPLIADMVEGLVTVEDVEAVPGRRVPVRRQWDQLRVSQSMSISVLTLRPETPLAEAVERLVAASYRAAPVVDDEGRVVGMVTNGDLVERGGARLRLELLGTLGADEIQSELTGLGAASATKPRTVAEVMSKPVVTIGAAASLTDAARLMVARRLKRLPVVDSDQKLLGVISRVDLLRAAAQASIQPMSPAEPREPLGVPLVVGDLPRSTVPVVADSATLSAVIAAVVSTRLNRALVVDWAGRLLGIVTDAELVRRLGPGQRRTVLETLASRLPFTKAGEKSGESEARRPTHPGDLLAGDLMISPVPTAQPNDPLGPAVTAMLRERRKVLPIVDANGKLIGAVDRADLLRAIAGL